MGGEGYITVSNERRREAAGHDVKTEGGMHGGTPLLLSLYRMGQC